MRTSRQTLIEAGYYGSVQAYSPLGSLVYHAIDTHRIIRLVRSLHFLLCDHSYITMHSAIIVTSLVAFAAAQAPNTLGNYNPNLRTASYNASKNTVPIHTIDRADPGSLLHRRGSQGCSPGSRAEL